MRRSRGPLPESDASVDALSDEDRKWLSFAWAGRADSELTACLSFGVVAEALRGAGEEPALIELAERAIEDERYHSQICHRLASIYLGAEAPAPKAHTLTVPAHPGAPEEVRRTLHVLGQCCFNETTGSVFYELCLKGAKSGPARAGLLSLLSDEVDHARIGWAHISSERLSPSVREAIRPWMGALVENNLRAWRGRYALPDRPSLLEHGCPSYDGGYAAVITALDEIIIPGLASFGFRIDQVARRARAQVEQGSPFENRTPD